MQMSYNFERIYVYIPTAEHTACHDESLIEMGFINIFLYMKIECHCRHFHPYFKLKK